MAHIIRQCTVARDELHNAFTDLVHWQGNYWAAYRKGAAHVSFDGQATIAFSADRQRWREVASIYLPGDVRDPKLVPMGDRLACIFPVWVGGHIKRRLQQHIAFSENGCQWSTPRAILEPHWWLWRVVAFGGRYYGAAYTYNDGGRGPDRAYRTDWLVSDDMLAWERLSGVGTTEQGLGEAGFHFFADGTVWMISRRAWPQNLPAFFAASKPPYTSWELIELDRPIHSPVTIEHKGEIYVAGRRLTQVEGERTFPFAHKWSVGVWRVSPGKVEPVLHIPASGDCAYPGMLVDPEGRVCMTYYSQHAYDMGVLPPLARNIAAKPTAEGGGVASEPLVATDVYFAELDLSAEQAKK